MGKQMFIYVQTGGKYQISQPHSLIRVFKTLLTIITKTTLYKYTEKLTTKKMKIFR